MTKEKVIEGLKKAAEELARYAPMKVNGRCQMYFDGAIHLLKEQEPDQSKYEHHIDHTDCVWYKPEEGNECPATCSQYRDGWNDAMDYIFKDGKGYRPYVRG